MKKLILGLVLFSSIAFVTNSTYAHCEVPCGIYNDSLRVELIKEHILTIEKAMNQISEIQNSSTINYNQLIRWINTKEHHANLIQEIAEQYFLTQRVKFAKPSDKEKHSVYVNQLTYLHQLIVYAMKAKQSTDLKYIQDMQDATARFEKAYFGLVKHRHDHKGDHK